MKTPATANGHGKTAILDNENSHARFPHTRDTLLAKPADCGSGCEAAIPAPDASQRRVMASHPNPPPEGEGANVSLREFHDNTVVDIRELHTRYGAAVVHQNVSLTVQPGEVFALVGGSGCGKSTLLRAVIMLLRPVSGSIRVFGQEVIGLNDEQALPLRRRWGVMFERGALFSSLTVAENVAMVLREHTQLSASLIDEVVALKIALTGLPADAGNKYPSELSGGMRKRAALARALALDPELLFLDEPTAGLDPLSASGIDELVRSLRDTLGLTIMLVTHDLDLLWRAADRVAVLDAGHILGIGSMEELSKSEHPVIREYFYGPRGRAAREQSWKKK